MPHVSQDRAWGVHPALRESAGNAVMALRGFRTERGLVGGGCNLSSAAC